jgi:hypothetical protein
MRARGYLMGHLAMKLAEAEGRPPVVGKAEAKSAVGRAIRRVRAGRGDKVSRRAAKTSRI